MNDPLPDHERPVCALLMAGGSGLRLWPLSRADRTKPFLRRFGARTSLLADTAARLPFVPLQRTFVNVTRGLEGLVRTSLAGVADDHIIVAPEDRDTLPTLLFAISRIARDFPDATLLLLASDNTIGDPERFEETVTRCVRAARAGPHLVSLGIAPTEASTRFGYMALGEPYPGLDETWFGTGYVEKPPPELAERLLRGGRHDWNSGIFAWTVDTFREALHAYAEPEAKVFDALCAAESEAEREALFRELAPMAVDHGLLERVPASGGPVRHVFVRGRFPWDDLGTFESLTKDEPTDSCGNVLTSNVTAIGCRRSMLVSEGPYRLFAHSLTDMCVVVSDIGDTLVASRDALGDLRALLQEPIVVPCTLEGGAVRLARGPLVRRLGSERAVVAERTNKVVGLLNVQDAHVEIDGDRVTVTCAAAGEARGDRPFEHPDTPRLFVALDGAELARVGARLVVEALVSGLEGHTQDIFVTMSAGQSPKGIYRELSKSHRASVPWSRVTLVQMDEWDGIASDDPRSFARELRETLSGPLGMRERLLDGRRGESSVVELEREVLSAGGFALAVHGIGTNGHLGFNEPPDDGTSEARRARLAESTRAAAATRFTHGAPEHGLTLGLRSLARAKRTLVVASGTTKVEALRGMLGAPSPSSPASSLARTRALDVLVDRALFCDLQED